jgi:hypothetical protein
MFIKTEDAMRIALFILAVALSTPALAADPSKAPTAEQPAANKDKLICRREVPIGSLIASRKVCLTKAQWAAREADGNEAARKLVYDNMGRPPGN